MTRRPLRIGILAENFPPLSGGIAAAHESLARLLQPHHVVARFAFLDPRPSSPDDHLFRFCGAPILNRLLGRMTDGFVRRHDPVGRAQAARAIAETIPAAMALGHSLRRFRPDVVFLSDDRVPALALRKPPGAKFIWMAHHNYTRFASQPALPSAGWYDPFLAHRLERRGTRKADYAVFPSRYMETVFRETLAPELPGRVIPNAVDLQELKSIDRATERTRFDLRKDSVLVCLPSGGSPVKGERHTFEIVRRLASTGPDVRFLITGHIEAALDRELAALPKKIVLHRPGKTEHLENLKNVAACDLVVSPTLIENFSCALLEAQALGIPVVTFDTGGNRELVEHGTSGFVAPYLDMESLVEHAAHLIRDSSRRTSMGHAAKVQAARLVDPQRLLQALDEVFTELGLFDERPACAH